MQKDLLSIYTEEFSETKILNRDSEIILHKKIKNGCKESFDLFVKSNLGLVMKFANRNKGRGVDFLDLIQAGNIGLLTAIEKFDNEKGFKFSTYAVWWIKQEIANCIFKEGKTIRINPKVRKLIRDYYIVCDDLKNKLSRNPTQKEIVKNSEFTKEQVRKIIFYLSHTYKTSKLSEIQSEEEEDYIDLLTTESIDTPVSSRIKEENKIKIEKYLSVLTNREKDILVHRFGLHGNEEITLEIIGEMYGISRERVRQIEARALAKIRNKNWRNL